LRFSTEIRSGEFPIVFERFESAIGSSLWRRRVEKIKEEIRGNRYLREWLLEENRIAFVLNAYSAQKVASRSRLHDVWSWLGPSCSARTNWSHNADAFRARRLG
jgi:hypothetical protein